jgi:hypothetical protein
VAPCAVGGSVWQWVGVRDGVCEGEWERERVEGVLAAVTLGGDSSRSVSGYVVCVCGLASTIEYSTVQ